MGAGIPLETADVRFAGKIYERRCRKLRLETAPGCALGWFFRFQAGCALKRLKTALVISRNALRRADWYGIMKEKSSSIVDKEGIIHHNADAY